MRRREDCVEISDDRGAAMNIKRKYSTVVQYRILRVIAVCNTSRYTDSLFCNTRDGLVANAMSSTSRDVYSNVDVYIDVAVRSDGASATSLITLLLNNYYKPLFQAFVGHNNLDYCETLI